MTANRGLFVRQDANGLGTQPVEARRAIAGLLCEDAPGVPRVGLLNPSTAVPLTGTTTMSYTLAPVQVVTNRAADEGVYLYSFTGTTTVATTAAPGTGSRWDLIYVKQNDVEKGDANNLAVLGVVQGTAAANPAKPYADARLVGATVLAEALVPAGATRTDALTITQVWNHMVARGVPIPVRNDTERNALTGRPGLQVSRLDQASALETWMSAGTWSPLNDVIRPVSPDANWSSGITLSRQVSADGTRMQISAGIQIYRVGGPGFNIDNTWLTILTGGIPVGWRPSPGSLPGTVGTLDGGGGFGAIHLRLTPKDYTIGGQPAAGLLQARTAGGTTPVGTGASIFGSLEWIQE